MQNALSWGCCGLLVAIPAVSACGGSRRPEITLPVPRHALEEKRPNADPVTTPPSRPTTRVTGDVRFLDSSEGEPDLGPVVVYLMAHPPLRPQEGVEGAATIRSPLVITSRNTAFDPPLAAVGRGRGVVFANEGPLSHALFSADLPGAKFALPPSTRTRRIDLPPRGPIRFYCSLHADESFVVFAPNTEYVAVVEGHAPYSLGPVEAGVYTLSIWSPRVSGPVRDVVVDGYSRAIEPVWIDPALVRPALATNGGSR